MLEPDRQSGVVARSPRTPASTPGVNETRSSESCRIVRVSPGAAEEDLLVRDQAAHPQPVHPDAVDVGAAGAVEPGRGRVGHRRAAGLAAGRGDQLRRTTGGAGGRVGLVGVVQLDDLDGLEERRRLRGEAHHQDRADGEVGGDQHADAGRVGQPSAQLVEPAVVEAGRADDGVDAVLDAERAGCPSPRRGG